MKKYHLCKNMLHFYFGIILSCTFSTMHRDITYDHNNNSNNEKALRETQTLHAGCSKVEPKIFAPPQTPFPVAQDSQN